jgi:hypothetical protein
LELPQGEVPRINLPRTRVNKPMLQRFSVWLTHAA